MEITIAGSGTIVPRLARRQSCVVVRAGGASLVFDLGSGAVRGMLHAGLAPFDVDRIFFTHFHPDHTVDVVPLLFAIKYGAAEPRTRPLYLTGPEPFESSGRKYLTSGENGWSATIRWKFPNFPTNVLPLSTWPAAAYPGLRPNIDLRASPTGWRAATGSSSTPATRSTANRWWSWHAARTPC